MTAQPANAPENPSAFLNEPFPGMTLRDYFAGQVLAGQESMPDYRGCPNDRRGDIEE